MPRKIKAAVADQAALSQIPVELLEKLIPGPVTAAQLEDIFQQFKEAFIQQALGAELSHHLFATFINRLLSSGKAYESMHVPDQVV